MPSRSIVIKLWLAFSALILVVMIPLQFALSRQLNDFYAQQVTEPLLYHSQQLADVLAVDPTLISMAPAMGQMVGGEVIVLNRAGAPMAFLGASKAEPPARATTAALAGSTFAGQVILKDNRTVIVTAVPIPGQGGAVLLLAPVEPVQHSLTVARRYLWLAGAAALLLGTGLGLMLARRLLHPVISIEQATRAIARGDFSARVAVETGDEFGQLAVAVNQMSTQLEDYEHRRREFLANVAHELRTPLSYIRGYTQALGEGLVTAPEERERIQHIVQEEAVRVGRLVDDLMDLAQMEEGQMGFAIAPLDLLLPVEQAAATVRPQAEAKGVRLDVSLAPDLPAIAADGGRIQQVVFNLLDNALRHTPAGGQITVAARTDDGFVTVRVADTGSGIDPDQLPLIFERFHKRHSSGRGLGLAVVRSIVRAHGGEVGVESKPGQGSTFWFRLPVQR
ncbi:MAG TPA: HAMP domain-containing sensor histidine kinase [Symbiobacteriaceae bacterium]|jgi:signal transduction histidine kinase